jgi:predicted nucleic acid-binding Zn ribbon protein
LKQTLSLGSRTTSVMVFNGMTPENNPGMQSRACLNQCGEILKKTRKNWAWKCTKILVIRILGLFVHQTVGVENEIASLPWRIAKEALWTLFLQIGFFDDYRLWKITMWQMKQIIKNRWLKYIKWRLK